jgi:ABC-type uncharacterized transport system auxiliary subunit
MLSHEPQTCVLAVALAALAFALAGCKEAKPNPVRDYKFERNEVPARSPPEMYESPATPTKPKK